LPDGPADFPHSVPSRDAMLHALAANRATMA